MSAILKRHKRKPIADFRHTNDSYEVLFHDFFSWNGLIGGGCLTKDDNYKSQKIMESQVTLQGAYDLQSWSSDPRIIWIVEIVCKVCSFWSCVFLALCSRDTRVHEKILPLSYHAIVILAINSFLQRLIFPQMYCTKSRDLNDFFNVDLNDSVI